MEPADIDELYRHWASANADSTELSPLLESIHSLLRTVVSRKLRGTQSEQEIEDICSEALVEVLSRMEAIRTSGATAIQSFAAYVARIGYNAVSDHFRRRYPQRHRLRNRLRYLLKTEARFALWEAGDAGWLTALQRYQAGRIGTIPESLPSASAVAPLWEIAAAMLEAARGPVPFDSLVDHVAALCGIRDQQVPLEDTPAPLHEDFIASRATQASWTLCLRDLWTIIGELPVAQRVALLLNLKGEENDSPVLLFPLTGVASIEEIAAMLEIQLGEFVILWGRLPLGDQEIAQRLQLTRQQVINLRMSARKRLARNLPEVINRLH